jgi:hypothetical protein
VPLPLRVSPTARADDLVAPDLLELRLNVDRAALLDLER